MGGALIEKTSELVPLTDHELVAELARIIDASEQATVSSTPEAQARAAELQAELSARLAQTRLGRDREQELEAVVALTGSVAHDLNNLLAVIMTYSNLVLEELEPDSSLRGDLDEVCQATARAAELTRQLLALGGQQTRQPRVLDLSRVGPLLAAPR